MSIARRELKVKVIGEGQCKMCVLHEYQLQRGRNESVLFISRPRSEGWQHHGRAFSIYLCTLIDSCRGSAVHVLMLSIQAVLGLPCLRAPCIISFSRQLVVSSWCDHSMLASLLWRCLTVPSLLRSFVFCAVYETRRIFLSPFISKASKRNCSAFTAVRWYRTLSLVVSSMYEY